MEGKPADNTITTLEESVESHLAALAAEDLLLEAGIGIFYHFTLVDVILSEDKSRIETAILHSKGGFSALSAKIFIDSTGDGDLAALAGCRHNEPAMEEATARVASG